MTGGSASLHDPVRDRLLGPLVAPVGRAVARLTPPAVLPLLGLGAAAGALGALLAGANLAGGVLVLLAGLLDVAGATAMSGQAVTQNRGAGAPAEADTRGGVWGVVDGVADRYADTLILAGMAAWSHTHEDYPAPLGLGFAALIGSVVLSYALARVQASAGRAATALFAWAGRDVRLVVAALGAVSGQVYIALVILLVLTIAPVAWALLRLPRHLKG